MSYCPLCSWAFHSNVHYVEFSTIYSSLQEYIKIPLGYINTALYAPALAKTHFTSSTWDSLLPVELSRLNYRSLMPRFIITEVINLVMAHQKDRHDMKTRILAAFNDLLRGALTRRSEGP
ncbi:hypothetical protein VN97_g8421 [Penicillium thymicola]|uniref:Uncharacterized protein n=1 Tax=Penicillium thymicola TaxID=293382 RepID=A0AAI9X667_PENTH|nr:hypothetical protein VN97_g8421 [Penicillium thymicola]